jgi:hypothetical protein
MGLFIKREKPVLKHRDKKVIINNSASAVRGFLMNKCLQPRSLGWHEEAEVYAKLHVRKSFFSLAACFDACYSVELTPTEKIMSASVTRTNKIFVGPHQEIQKMKCLVLRASKK